MDEESTIPYHKVQQEDPTKRLRPVSSKASRLIMDHSLITMASLEKLFEPDNIRESESIKSLRNMGGLEELAKDLGTSADDGIDDRKLQSHIEKYGKNDPIIKAPKGLLKLICEQLEDTMLRILILAGIVSLIVGMIKDGPEEGWMEGVTIFVAIMIVVVVGSTNNYLKEKQFAELTSKHDARDVLVVRNGERKYISIFELTVGDLMCFDIGEIFPVDGIMVKGSRVLVDESSVTGESDLIPKENINEALCYMDPKKQPFLVSGSKCIDGTGEMIVCCIAENSRMGKLRMSLTDESPPTPLQLKLEKVAEDIGKVGVAVALLTFVSMLLHLVITCAKGDETFLSMETLNQIVDFLILGITIIVVAVPEGLPLAVTIALAYSVGKMKDENNLVRHMPSCEIMGGANNICTDKTGTLTQNKMSVVELFFLGQSYKTSEVIGNSSFKTEAIQTFCEGICINSTANPVFEQGKPAEQLGNKTECALLELAKDLNYSYKDVRKKLKVVRSVPFSSSRKKMSTVVATEDPDRFTVYTKGASEYLLANCRYFLDENCRIKDLTKEKKAQLEEKVIKKMAQSSLRTLAITFTAIKEKELQILNDEELEQETTLLAIVGIKDPLREGVIEAINKCKQAGITVRMVTGDNTQTAVAIARECGILRAQYDHECADSDDYTVMEGKKFRELVEIVENQEKNCKEVKDELTFSLIESKLRVLARSSPEDKYALVTGLIQMGRVVAATGDGTNDAPALKKADIGFAMGISGTRVAQEAAGIILLDDNFSSIVTACKWGRNIYDSIRKFLQFQLTVNLVALFMAFLGGVVVKKSPLNSIQMLWVNLIMDTFASLALATEPPNEELLKRTPYSRTEYIITGAMWRNVFGQAVYQIAMLTVILFKGPQMFDVSNSYDDDKYSEENAVHFTIFFNTFVFMQIFNEINCRKLKSKEFNVFKGFFNNPLFLLIEIVTIGVQILIVTFGGSFVKVSKLSVYQHLYCVAMGAGSLVFGFIMKLLPEDLFSKIPFLKDEEPFKIQEIDGSLSSLLKKKASSRFRLSSGGSRKLSSNSQVT